ncbi:serine hydroxymethyltransferase [Eubacteriales bacterium KG127]
MFTRDGKDNGNYNRENVNFIRQTSKKVADLIEREYERQLNNVELIASENYCSEAVLAACGSCLSWKYAEGYPELDRETGSRGRYYGGTEFVDQLEEYCCFTWKKVFDTDYHVNVQPHSGSQANFSAYKVAVNSGDTVLSFSLDNGGHLTHGSKVNFSGKLYNMVFYAVDEKGYIDMEDVRRKAIECKPKLIVAGASAYSRLIDFKAFSEIAKEVGALFMVDMAHIAGLVAAGCHPTPFGFADLITTTTHKTLRGPRGGLIFAKPELAKKVDSAVFPYAQGGPLEHIIAGKAVCAEEALTEEYKKYIHQVIKNSKAFCQAFIDMGYKIVTGGTDNHLFMMDLSEFSFSGRTLQDELDKIGITLNKNMIPNDQKSPRETSGVRIGTAPMTTRGYMEEDFIEIAKKIDAKIRELSEK